MVSRPQTAPGSLAGLHCGVVLVIMDKGDWRTVRLEIDDDWYLVGHDLRGVALEGLAVRL